jgi:putative redox protein
MPEFGSTEARKERFEFFNADGERLAGLLEAPADEPVAYAIFAHCFTCSKDIAAASRISRALAGHGIGVLRFDFTGLGNSEGDFANTNFSSNVADLLAAAQGLRHQHAAPGLLIGHSLGGAAVLAAAGEIPEARAVVTIGAPSEPGHVAHLLEEKREEIESRGEAVVNLAGRRFTIKRQFLQDIEAHQLSRRVREMRKALLVMHSPVDEIVAIDNATSIFQAALHPKSFVSLDTADHLLSRRADSEFVAATVAAWARRYLLDAEAPAEPLRPALASGEVMVRERDGKFTQEVFTDHHRLLADEPASYGGKDAGPSPYAYLLAALGACTNMTVRIYAERKGIALDEVAVRLVHDKILDGDLSAEDRESLLRIADRCPVHRTLHSVVDIQTRLGD